MPMGITEVEKRAVIAAAEKAKTQEVHLLEEPLATAIGSGLPIHEPTALMVVDMGGATTEVAVICSSTVSYWESIRVAGDEMDEAIAHCVREKYNIDVDIYETERVKKTIGCVSSLPVKLEPDVRGKDASIEMPKTVRVDSEAIRESLNSTVMDIVKMIRKPPERISSAIAADLYDKGIVLAGGGELLRGLVPFMQNETGLPVQLAEDPLTAIVRGAGKVLENISRYQEV